MTQIRHFWAGITNFISKDRHLDSLTATPAGAEKMGYSYSTHLSTYSSQLVDGIEEYFNLYHSAMNLCDIGKHVDVIPCLDICQCTFHC
jgi:hypothetical protein